MPGKKVSIKKAILNTALNDAKELERLRRDIYRPDMEKLKLFTKMLRPNALFAKAIITHK